MDLEEEDKMMIYNKIFEYIDDINKNIKKNIKGIYKTAMKSIIDELEKSQNDVHINFAKNIKYFRSLNKISQEELADMMNISRQAISKWELGKSEPEIDHLCELSHIFNIEADVLLGNYMRNRIVYTEKTII